MNVVITGASKGIGKACAQMFCQNNTENLILIARSEELLKKVKSECTKLNNDVKIHIINMDLYSLLAGDKNEGIESIKQITNNIDILVNNAGLLINKPFRDTSIDEADEMLKSNFLAPAKLIQILLPLLESSANAHIVNIGSMGGFQGSSKYPGLSFYSAGKAALACLGECLAVEFKNSPVKVNTLSLGAVQTEMLNEAFPGYKAPLTADEMAEFIVDFSINGWKYFNGKILPVALSNP